MLDLKSAAELTRLTILGVDEVKVRVVKTCFSKGCLSSKRRDATMIVDDDDDDDDDDGVCSVVNVDRGCFIRGQGVGWVIDDDVMTGKFEHASGKSDLELCVYLVWGQGAVRVEKLKLGWVVDKFRNKLSPLSDTARLSTFKTFALTNIKNMSQPQLPIASNDGATFKSFDSLF
jgi:hypothetical protein